MFFNNFNITHTSDDLPFHVGVMRNESAERGLTASVAALAGVQEQVTGGDFLISPDGYFISISTKSFGSTPF